MTISIKHRLLENKPRTARFLGMEGLACDCSQALEGSELTTFVNVKSIEPRDVLRQIGLSARRDAIRMTRKISVPNPSGLQNDN
jgi:hypothetical protein